MKNTNSPFSVGFPLVIRKREESLAICGANRGEGWPILCEVPIDTHHERDADSIAKACTAYLDHAALAARVQDLERALHESDDCLALMTSHAKNYMPGGFPLPFRAGKKHCAEHLLADRIAASHEIARRALTGGAT